MVSGKNSILYLHEFSHSHPLVDDCDQLWPKTDYKQNEELRGVEESAD